MQSGLGISESAAPVPRHPAVRSTGVAAGRARKPLLFVQALSSQRMYHYCEFKTDVKDETLRNAVANFPKGKVTLDVELQQCASHKVIRRF
jgi:hypothetical protein